MMGLMSDSPSIVAGVLVGGKSTRMGANKATLPWGDSTIIETIVETVRRVSPRCVLLGACDELPNSLADLKQLPDAHPGIGPMAGLYSLLAGHPDRWSLLISCDVPNVTCDVINNLVVHITPAARAVVYTTNSRPEPCCALYHAGILPDVERAIADRQYSLTRLIARLSPLEIEADTPIREALGNINTPEDYRDRA